MIAANFEIGWEALVAIIVLIAALTVLGIVALTRELRQHHLRVGFFVERGDELSDPHQAGQAVEGWPEPDVDDTKEIPP